MISQKLTVAVTWNWHTKCPAYMCTICQNVSSLPQAVQKLSLKVFIFDSFQDPCSISFQDHHIVLNIGSFIYVVCQEREILIQISFQDPHYDTGTHFSGKTYAKCKIWFISRPLILVSFTAQWQVGQLIFQPPKFDWHAEDQQLAFAEWRGQISVSPRSVQHSKGHMVHNNRRLPR